MRRTLNFSEISVDGEQREKINENDPKHLRLIITGLIDKSKSIISTLESTVEKLEKTQKQRDYWKNNYLQFREACLNYVHQDQIQLFHNIIKCEDQIKRVNYHRSFEEEQAKVLHSLESTVVKRKGKISKSISTLSLKKERDSPQRSSHRINPKKIDISHPKINKVQVRKSNK